MAQSSTTTYTYTCDYPDCAESMDTDKPLETKAIKGSIADGMWVILNLDYRTRHYCTKHGREAAKFIPSDMPARSEVWLDQLIPKLDQLIPKS